MQSIGVLGLGIIGESWANRYQAAGRLAGTWNRTPKPHCPRWKRTALEVVAASDVTQIVVADPPAVSAVLDAILPALGKGKAIVIRLVQGRSCNTARTSVIQWMTGTQSEAIAMRNQTTSISAAIAVLVVAGCGHSTPVTAVGPSLSNQGVQVGITHVSCSTDRDEDPISETAAQDHGEFEVRLWINNQSGKVARFAEKRMRLVDSAVPAGLALTPADPQVVFLLPGETKNLQVRFKTSADLNCRHRFELVLADTVRLSAPPIDFTQISISGAH